MQSSNELNSLPGVLKMGDPRREVSDSEVHLNSDSSGYKINLKSRAAIPTGNVNQKVPTPDGS